MGKITILIIEDEKDIRDLLEIYLTNEDYNVIKSKDGSKTIEILETSKIDLIILDIMLPGIDGITLCSKIRKNYDIPILILSARGNSSDKILGIKTGADDYVAKPFDPLEVIVRIKSLLKRCTKNSTLNELQKNKIIIVENLTIDLDNHEVMVDQNKIALTNKEFEILTLMAMNRGIVFSSRRIYENVWKESFFESDSTIMTHIKNLREKIGDNFKNPRFIKTVWGVGYKIEK